jgi:outer membrane protein assembly factor BamB
MFAMKYYPDARLVSLGLETGELQWNERLQGEGPHLAESSPILMGSRVVGGLKNGQFIGRDVTDNGTYSGPSAVNGSVTTLKSLGDALVVGTSENQPGIYITTPSGIVCQEYHLEGPAYEIVDLAINDDNIYYATVGDVDGHHNFGSVGVIDPESESVQWEVITTGRVQGFSVADNSVFVRTDNHAVAFDGETGSRLWQVNTNGGSDATPTVSNGTVYFGGLSTIVAADAMTGDIQWKHQIPAKNARPVVAGDTVYFTADRILDRPAIVGALTQSTGDVVWEKTIERRRLSTPVVGAEYVLVAANRRPQGPPGTDRHEKGTSEIIAFE